MKEGWLLTSTIPRTYARCWLPWTESLQVRSSISVSRMNGLLEERLLAPNFRTFSLLSVPLGCQVGSHTDATCRPLQFLRSTLCRHFLKKMFFQSTTKASSVSCHFSNRSLWLMLLSHSFVEFWFESPNKRLNYPEALEFSTAAIGGTPKRSCPSCAFGLACCFMLSILLRFLHSASIIRWVKSASSSPSKEVGDAATSLTHASPSVRLDFWELCTVYRC